MADERIEAVITAKDLASPVIKNFAGTIIAANQAIELMGKAMRALVAPFASIIKEGAEFTAQMSKIKSISKITAEEFSALSKEAKRIGETTAFTATQAAQGMEELRRAGFGAAQTIAIAGDAMDLAAAQAADLAETSRLVGIAFKLFSKQGLSAEDIVNDFNKAVGSSAQNIVDFTEAFKFAAGQASAFNQPLSEVTKTIALLADVGFKGTLAGTALRGAITRLAKPTKEAQVVLEDLNLSLSDINPETNKFTDILVKLRNAGISNTQVLTLFGQIAGGKFIKVIQDINTLLPEYEQKLNNAKTAQESARDALDNLTGDFTLFKSALSGLQIAIFEEMEEQLRDSAKEATNFVKGLTQFVKENKDLVSEIIDNIFTLGSAIATMTIGALRGLGMMLIGFGKVQRFLEAVGAAIGIVIGDIITDFVLIGTEIDEMIIQIQRGFNNLTQAVSNFIDDLVKGLKEFGADMAKIPGVLADVFIKDFQRIVDFWFDKGREIVDFFSNAFSGLEAVMPDPEPIPEPVINTATRAGEALLDMADSMELAFDKAKEFNGETEKTNKTLQETNTAVQNVAKSTKNLNLKKLGGVSSKDVFGDFKIPTDTIAGIGQDFGKRIARQIPGVSGAIQGFQAGGPIGGIAGFFGDLLMRTEGFQEAMKIIGDALIELMEPIGKLLVPIAKFIAKIIRKLAPVIDKIAKVIGKVLEKVLPILETFLELIFPFVDGFLRVLLPLLDAVLPAMLDVIEILEPIFEVLEPVMKLLSDFLKTFMPAFKFAIMAAMITSLAPIIAIKVTIELVKKGIDIFVGLFKNFSNIFNGLVGFIQGAFNMLMGVLNPVLSALRDVVNLIKKLIDIIPGAGGGIGGGGMLGGIGSGLLAWSTGGISSALGFQQGSTGLTRDQLLRLPGMEAGSGLVKAHVGEQIIPNGEGTNSGNVFNFNIKAIDPRNQVEEIRQVLETLSLERKISLVTR